MADAPNTSPKKSEEERFTLGNFEMLRDANGAPLLLGKGTFGRTYKARHRFLDTVVALKVINERYAADPTVRQRFLVEGKAVARLSHPHIARIYDFGETDGALYYAMEFCSGGNLAAYVQKSGPLDVPNSMDIAIQMSGALGCAHADGFVHRDVKPSNIMLAGPNTPLSGKLIDFGLVHAADPDTVETARDDDPTDDGQFFGTPLFASPEQLREQPVDGRSDVFSLGMTIWYLLLGGSPEPGSSAAIASSRLSSESYMPRLPKNIPDPYRLLLARLLEKDPERRILNGSEAHAAFTQCALSLGLAVKSDLLDAAAVELSKAAESASSQNAPSAEIEVVDGSFQSTFKTLSRQNETLTGTYYSADSQAAPERTGLFHVLHAQVAEDTVVLGKIRAHVGRLQSLALSSVIRPLAILRYSDFTVIDFGPIVSDTLLTTLRSQGIIVFEKAIPFLDAMAHASDEIQDANLPGVDLLPGLIFLAPKDPSAGKSTGVAVAEPRLLPRLLSSVDSSTLETSDSADASSTMTSDTFSDPDRESNPCGQFASVIYRIVSGRSCPAAASLSAQAYVATPGLSERANRILSSVIAGQANYSTCGDLLRELAGVEGISTVAGPQGTSHGTAALSRTRPYIPPPMRTEAGAVTKAPVATAAPVASLPPVAHSIPHVAYPQATKPGRRLNHLFLIGGAVACIAVAAYFILGSKPHPPNPPAPSPAPSNLPEKLAVQLQNDSSVQPVFKIAGKPAAGTQQGDDWYLALRQAAPSFPFTVAVEAVGYDSNEVTVQSSDDLTKPVSLALTRSAGTIDFSAIPTEFTNASCLMKDALPEEKDHVDIPKYPIGTELHGDATTPFELPTGIYLVSLKGKSVPQRWPALAVIRQSGTFSMNLPPLIEGSYAGKSTGDSSGSASDLAIHVVLMPHSGGWMKRGDDQQTLVEGRLDPQGAYKARALPSANSGNNASDATILMRYTGNDSFDVYLSNPDAPDAQDLPLLGTVHRIGDL